MDIIIILFYNTSILCNYNLYFPIDNKDITLNSLNGIIHDLKLFRNIESAESMREKLHKQND